MQRTHRVQSRATRRSRVPVVVVGLGPIGREVATLVVGRPDLFRLVGAVDRAPELVGRALASVLGRKAPRAAVRASVESVPKVARGIAFHTIASQLADVVDSVETLVARG